MTSSLARPGLNRWARDATTPYGIHYSLGAQREIAHNLVLSADFVHRQFVHIPFGSNPQDYNHFNSVVAR